MQSFSNYLKTYRRRAGLSQDELAYLLGGETGTTISRHETGKRLPSLDTALAYEMILGAPVKAIFAGEAETIHKSISDRAEKLAKRLTGSEPTPESSQKLETIGSMILGDSEEPKYIPICNEYER